MKVVAFACPRDAVATLAERKGETLAGLSRFIGRPEGFLARFVRDGVPSRLLPDERAMLARYLGADERDLGAENVPPRAPQCARPAYLARRSRRYDWYDARNRVS